MAVPEISCVVPAYENPDLVVRCLTSLAAQSGVEVEIILTDDSTTARVGDLARSLADLLPHLRYVAGPRTGNPVENWNAGLSLASAPHHILVHQDEFLVDPTYLRRAVEALKSPKVAAVQAGVRVIGVDRPSRFALASALTRRLPGARSLLPAINWIGPTAAFAFRAGPRFDPALVQLVDVEFYGRVLATGRLARLPGVSVGSLGHHHDQITARIDVAEATRRDLSVLSARRPQAVTPLARALIAARLALRATGG